MSINTFDGSVPNLISSHTIKDIENQLQIPQTLIDSNNNNKVIAGIGSFYESYVCPNLFPLIVITLLIIYLSIKYVLKQDREEKERKRNPKKIIPRQVIVPSTVPNKMNVSDLISDDYLITVSE